MKKDFVTVKGTTDMMFCIGDIILITNKDNRWWIYLLCWLFRCPLPKIKKFYQIDHIYHDHFEIVDYSLWTRIKNYLYRLW